MRVLVTGADGFIGSLLCPVLQDRGYRVRGAVRKSMPEHVLAFDWNVVGDIGPATNWTEALEGVDVVIHLAGRVHMLRDKGQDLLTEYRRANTEGTQKLLDTAIGVGVKRLVFTSTVHVNGESATADEPFVESDASRPRGPYAVSKWEAEQLLHAATIGTELETVIVRPALVYGPGVKGNFLRLVKLVDRGIPLPLRCTRNRRSFVSRTNLIDFLIRCVEHPAAVGETFLISDHEDVSTSELIRAIAAQFQRPVRLFPFPEPVIRLGGRVVKKDRIINQLWGSLVVDSSKARQVLDWQPPVALADELALLAEWFRKNG